VAVVLRAPYIEQADQGILEECRKIIAKQGSCKTGEAVITTAGNLPAKFVIHTVGPVWNDGKKNEAALLLLLVIKIVINLPSSINLSSIAFPNISTGIYGYPKKEAAEIALNTVMVYLKQNTFISKSVFLFVLMKKITSFINH
jgi:O-acetyl-ADP-ribose deacetylase (regulator of RNase III)